MIPQTPDIMQSPLCYEGDTRTIPTDTPLGTNQLSYKQGFPPITGIDVDAGGIAPERQDFNAALKLLSIHTYFLQSGNKYKYSNLLDYEIGSTVLGSDNALYYCIQANGATLPNTVQAPTSSTGYWVKVIDSQGILNIKVIGDGTITGLKLANDTITSTQIAANAITASELDNNAVDTNAIANNAVTNAKISDVAASKVTGLSTVAISGSYNDLSDKPTIPTNVAPRPTTANGLGVWININFVGSGGYTLPSGGTWAYLVITPTKEGTLPIAVGKDYIFSGIASGGTQVNTGNPDAFASQGFAWRIL